MTTEASAKASAPPATEGPRKPSRRLDGIDMARAFALGGMLLSHYATQFHRNDPGWLHGFADAPDGRAAPLFAIILGLGASILAARTPDRVLVWRGLVLFALGLALWPYADEVFLILPHYGILLMLIPLLRRLSTPIIAALIAVAFLTPSIVTAFFDDHALGGARQPQEYSDLLDLNHMVRHLLWAGGYPLVGWIGFALIGVLLSRLDLRDLRIQRLLLIGGIGLALLQPLVATIFNALDGEEHAPDASGIEAFLDSSAHSNRTAWYVIASGTACAILALCLLVTRRPRAWYVPLVALGQLSLSAYLAHILIGRQWLWPWRREELPSLATQVGLALAIFVALAALATAWRARFTRGPVESLMRAVAH